MAKKYFIDDSCHNIGGVGDPDFDIYVQEAMRLARRAVIRLQSATDSDFARVYNVLMKTPKNDTATYPRGPHWCLLNGHKGKGDPAPPKTVLQHVLANLCDFGTNWTRTRVRTEADVKLYADQLKRFKPHATIPRLWEDAPNDIYLPDSLIKCVENGVPVPKSTVAAIHISGYNNGKVSTIDFFPRSWRGMNQPIFQILGGGLEVGGDIPLPMDQISIMNLPKYIIHEFMHCYAYGCDDTNGPYPKGNPWLYSMRLEKSKAYQDADTMSMLAFVAGFADVKRSGKAKGGFTLDRIWDTIPGPTDLGAHTQLCGVPGTGNKWDPDFKGTPCKSNTAYEGLLVYYEDITK